jgi:hypothetical protein
MRKVYFLGCCVAIVVWGLVPAAAQTDAPKQVAKKPISVTVQKQLYRYVDNVGTKILGYADDLVYNGTTFTNLATAADVVKFKTCIATEIDVPRKDLKPIQGNCAGEPPIWGVTANQALEGRFISAEGQIAKFSLKNKDGKETIFTLPTEPLVGFKYKTDTTVLFAKPPTFWDFGKVTKDFDDMDSQKITKTIEEGGFKIYSAAK